MDDLAETWLAAGDLDTAIQTRVDAIAAFLLAGAAVVTAPLWAVDDATTPDFMAGYHAAPPAAAVQRRCSARRPLIYGPCVVTAWPG